MKTDQNRLRQTEMIGTTSHRRLPPARLRAGAVVFFLTTFERAVVVLLTTCFIALEFFVGGALIALLALARAPVLFAVFLTAFF